MAIADIDAAKIWYRILGHSGPWVSIIQGGRHPASDLREMAQIIANNGFHVLIHDRKNSGRSSFAFDSTESEEDIWVKDLLKLWDQLNIETSYVIGRSRGARVALKLGLENSDRVSGLFLWGISGGRKAARFLRDYYYCKYLTACKNGGMSEVAETGHIAVAIGLRPNLKKLILKTKPDQFLACMNNWQNHFEDNIESPVLGISQAQLSQITAATLLMPYKDSLHPASSIAFTKTSMLRSNVTRLHIKNHTESKSEKRAAAAFLKFEKDLRPSKNSLTLSNFDDKKRSKLRTEKPFENV